MGASAGDPVRHRHTYRGDLGPAIDNRPFSGGRRPLGRLVSHSWAVSRGAMGRSSHGWLQVPPLSGPSHGGGHRADSAPAGLRAYLADNPGSGARPDTHPRSHDSPDQQPLAQTGPWYSRSAPAATSTFLQNYGKYADQVTEGR